MQTNHAIENNLNQPEEAQPQLNVDQVMISTEMPNLEPRFGYEPIEDPRWTRGQRATPIKELEKVPVKLARPEMEVIYNWHEDDS